MMDSKSWLWLWTLFRSTKLLGALLDDFLVRNSGLGLLGTTVYIRQLALIYIHVGPKRPPSLGPKIHQKFPNKLSKLQSVHNRNEIIETVTLMYQTRFLIFCRQKTLFSISLWYKIFVEIFFSSYFEVLSMKDNAKFYNFCIHRVSIFSCFVWFTGL